MSRTAPTLPKYTPAERKAASAALRHYPRELVELAQNGFQERELVAAGFTQFEVSAVVALLTKLGVRRSTETRPAEGFREGL